MEQATLSPDRRTIHCPHRGCEMQVGVVRGERVGLMEGYRLSSAGDVWTRDPSQQTRGENKAPDLGAVVRCWSCRGLMTWPFGETLATT